MVQALLVFSPWGWSRCSLASTELLGHPISQESRSCFLAGKCAVWLKGTFNSMFSDSFAALHEGSAGWIIQNGPCSESLTHNSKIQLSNHGEIWVLSNKQQTRAAGGQNLNWWWLFFIPSSLLISKWKCNELANPITWDFSESLWVLPCSCQAWTGSTLQAGEFPWEWAGVGWLWEHWAAEIKNFLNHSRAAAEETKKPHYKNCLVTLLGIFKFEINWKN